MWLMTTSRGTNDTIPTVAPYSSFTGFYSLHFLLLQVSEPGNLSSTKTFKIQGPLFWALLHLLNASHYGTLQNLRARFAYNISGTVFFRYALVRPTQLELNSVAKCGVYRKA